MTKADAASTVGRPVWIDLLSPDIEAAQRFYQRLFGWTADEPDPMSGGYRVFRKDGLRVAGGMPITQETEGQPSAWGTYMGVENVDSVVTSVRAEGGNVLAEPIDVMDLGRMAVFADPTDAVFSVWQPGTLPGVEVFGEPGTMCWSELQTRDPEGAKHFYTRVFGWGTKDHPGEGFTYTEWYANGRRVGGLLPMVGDHWPANVPSHWMVYFAVEDCDAAAARAAELDGQVAVQPFEIRSGRMAVLSDPTGAHFAIIAPSKEHGPDS
jgi:uncharacterized protein